MKLFFSILFFGAFVLGYSQNSTMKQQQIDSLKRIIGHTKIDSIKINAYIDWGNLIYIENPTLDFELNTKVKISCIKNLRTKLTKAEKRFFKYHLANAVNNIGNTKMENGNYQDALKDFLFSLKIRTEIKDRIGITSSLNNIGNCYKEQTRFPTALHYFLLALQQIEKLGNNTTKGVILCNIGNVYLEQNENEKALKYFLKALTIAKKANQQISAAINLGNIGIAYKNMKNYSKALSFTLQALNINYLTNDTSALSRQIGNIGTIYYESGNHNKALEYYLKALNLHQYLKNKKCITADLSNIGLLYLVTGKFTLAKQYMDQALTTAGEINSYYDLMTAHEHLYKLHETTQQHALAFSHFKKYISYKDSITNTENTKKQIQMEMQYEFDKTQTADSIKNAEHAKQETLKHNQEIKQQRIYTYGGIIGFGLMLIVAFVSFRAFRNKQKANHIIAEQKALVEEKQKEILDSIRYAKRIQLALLPSEKYIARQLARYRGCKPRDRSSS